MIDLRHEAPDRQTRSKVRIGKTVMRDPSTITGLVLHQTGTMLPITARQIRRSGGDRVLAKARRMARMPVHGAASACGLAVLTRPLESYLYAANGFNETTLSIEFEGRYPGLDDGSVPSSLICAGVELIREIVREGRALGMPLEWFYAHRQSSPSRRADPGEQLWRMMKPVAESFGLTSVPELRLRSTSKKAPGLGRAIPEDWDADGVGRY